MPMTKYPFINQMRIQHTFILGFVYSVGYFVPTLLLIQAYGKEANYLQEMIISNLSYDLIFTVIISYCLLHRKVLEIMRIRLILPIILCIISIYISEHVGVFEQGFVRKITGR